MMIGTRELTESLLVYWAFTYLHVKKRHNDTMIQKTTMSYVIVECHSADKHGRPIGGYVHFVDNVEWSARYQQQVVKVVVSHMVFMRGQVGYLQYNCDCLKVDFYPRRSAQKSIVKLVQYLNIFYRRCTYVDGIY